MAVATSSFSLPLHFLRSTASSSRLSLGQGALRRTSPSARGLLRLQLRPTARGLETVVAAALYDGGEAAARGDGGDVSAAAELVRAARTGGGPNGRPGQPKEGGGGSVNATVLAQRARAPTPPGSPAEGSGGQGGSIH
ncbi:hypothetical protein U9M48_040702 [Paspalum notatum var. saurae]|uniref:Uncharacterized protein n=1 Tax=Paspalum notatum var. saurae TaxID=547442 RepID=A0AAQ3UR43_PASNO